MTPRHRLACAALLTAVALSACSSGPVRRVSDPAASLQQIQVLPSGNWALELRLHNYSSIPMRFDQVNLTVKVDGHDAAVLQQAVGITIGPESPDIVKMTVNPTLAGKADLAESLTRRATFNYRLTGSISAAPDKAGVRTFKVDQASSLNPAPGLDGVLR